MRFLDGVRCRSWCARGNESHTTDSLVGDQQPFSVTATKPAKNFRVGLCSASVFRNASNGEGGKNAYLFTVAVQRSHRDEGQWKSATNFGLTELPQVTRAMQLAQQFVEQEEAEVQSNEEL